MKFISLEPFVPSGSDFEASKQLFQELGFTISWSTGEYIGFERDECKFILQKYDNKEFAENFMLSVKVDNIEQFRSTLIDNKIVEKFGINIGQVTFQPYGKEVNIIDIAGVCWHFVE